jgi:hypothetical protein
MTSEKRTSTYWLHGIALLLGWALNGSIAFAFRAPAGRPVVICRADGDQDRPSVVQPRALAPSVLRGSAQ